MSATNTVSLCMIVKDEADLILECLNSVQHLVNELIIVDTGSSDDTAKLATEAGARVFRFLWSGNFAEARNFALQQATGNWILVLDADEKLEQISSEDFARLLTDENVEGYFIHINNYLGSGQLKTTDRVVRLFRHKPSYRFEGALHEQIAPSILRANHGKGLATAPLTIHHCGYLASQIRLKNKFQRNTQIICEELAKNPDNPFLLYCLGLEYYQLNEVRKGLTYLEKALKLLRGSEGFFQDVILSTALGYVKVDETEKLITFIDKSLLMFPEHSDLIFLRGLAHFRMAHYPEAAQDFLATSLILQRRPEADPLVANYLSIAAREIHVYLSAIKQGLNNDHFPAVNRLRDLLENVLVVLDQTVFPEWNPSC